ncbi:hypothetical protein QR680_007972 [Steinernema hermaphroditum]|uniref:Uncharacterized protein n=1 Tax=Steinernema hermaphroditum TaxID=289476 RepID=A0AA39IH92_9BILA|nr:hypothetical protein QR680_007972 [Steinernema hermaphroditum]
MFIASLSNMVIVIAYIIERFEYEYCGIFICGWQLIAVSYFNDHCSLLKSGYESNMNMILICYLELSVGALQIPQ